MHPGEQPQITLTSRARRRLDAPENLLHLYHRALQELQTAKLGYAIHRNRHRLLMNEKMGLVGAVMDKDGFVVCKACLINHCDCWLSEEIYKTCIQHRRWLFSEQRLRQTLEYTKSTVEMFKGKLAGIEHHLRPLPSKFQWWAIEYSPSVRKLRVAEDDVLSFGYSEWPKRPEV